MQLEKATACRIARTAGELAQRYFSDWHDKTGSALAVEWKDGDEPVTAADRAVSDLCVSSLRREFPHDAILSEEAPDDGARRNATRTWTVDPIDGTKDFIAGRSGYSVMIGLLVDGSPVLGVVCQPTRNRLYWALRGGGAYVEDGTAAARLLRVSTIDVLSEARMVSSASTREPVVAEVRDRSGIRDELHIGSVGIKLSLIAAGERDLYINPAGHTKLWDTCPPSVILSEAGGLLTDLVGRPLDYRGELGHQHGLVASNGRLHDLALQQLAPFAAHLTR